MVNFIGICGGSGSGKSTLAYAIKDLFPDLVEVVHFDDYQKKRKDIPLLYGMTNWDDPKAVDFDLLLDNLTTLKQGVSVIVNTKSEQLNPNYKKVGRIEHTLLAKPTIIVEGYLAFYDKIIRNLFDYKIFLDLGYDERIKRRTKFVTDDYLTKILHPMHQQHIEPAKSYANLIVDVEKHLASNVLDLVLGKLKEENLFN